MGKITGLLVILVAVFSVLLFVAQGLFFSSPLWFPQDISTHGPAIDAQFMRTLIVVAIAFTAAQVALGYAIFRFGRRGGERATYTHGSNKLEATWTIITAMVFVTLAVLGQRVWAQLHLNEAPPDAMKIEVVAQQFKWTFHYPGKDGIFGRTDPKFINDDVGNFVGLNPSDANATNLPEGTKLDPADIDPNAADDVQTGTLVIPRDRPVELTLRSKDVIHSFFVPVLRFKQDTVPGLAIKVHFTATKTGKFEIPCAELCGNRHYTMKGFLLVVPGEEYDQLIQLPQAEFTARMNALDQQYGGQQQSQSQ
ncbi:MAG TPA: cytochrome c oxidase subunit II [Blastocatellia bacterium]|nr:cytochrome c oxidase subunit II [Blastocatellia bacterium]